jgi:hypothetical protein
MKTTLIIDFAEHIKTIMLLFSSSCIESEYHGHWQIPTSQYFPAKRNQPPVLILGI